VLTSQPRSPWLPCVAFGVAGPEAWWLRRWLLMQGMECTDAHTDPVVVKLPAEIDVTCAARVGEELASAFSPEAPAVIADLTQTTFCDSSGVHALVHAYKQAADNGTKLILVTAGGSVRRIFDLIGIGCVVPVYASVDAAVADLQVN
jgi:anti-sigma B factor antagonist